MKKLGFTLAEVLITLGIIGVVAALTAPALVQNAGSAQIGPKLAKAVSTLELANQNMLTEAEAATMSSFMSAYEGRSENATYLTLSEIYNDEILPNYMKVTYRPRDTQVIKYQAALQDYQGENTFAKMQFAGTLKQLFYNSIGKGVIISKDGVMYSIAVGLNMIYAAANKELPKHLRLAGVVIIDINGFSEPNRLGRDAFLFLMLNDGSLRPVGGYDWYPASDANNEKYYWEDGTDDVCNEETVTTGLTCAGSIFENNLKVIYQ